MTTDRRTPGKARGLRRILSPDGFVLSCAIDHIDEFNELLPAGSGPAEQVEAKAALVRRVSPATSCVLLDAPSLSHAVHTGAVGGGVVASLENGDYSLDSAGVTVLRTGWGPAEARAAGVDGVKLWWWHRPDDELAAVQRRLLAGVVAECAAEDLLLVVEPIWYPRPGEDLSTRAWREARAGGIVEAAVTAERLGADVLKVQFPDDLGAPAGEDLARETLARLDAAVHSPWVLLSAGVAFETFERRLELACAAGASGYIAGRSLWREAVATPGAERPAAVALLLERLERLNAITRRYGRPVRS